MLVCCGCFSVVRLRCGFVWHMIPRFGYGFAFVRSFDSAFCVVCSFRLVRCLLRLVLLRSCTLVSLFLLPPLPCRCYAGLYRCRYSSAVFVSPLVRCVAGADYCNCWCRSLTPTFGLIRFYVAFVAMIGFVLFCSLRCFVRCLLVLIVVVVVLFLITLLLIVRSLFHCSVPLYYVPLICWGCSFRVCWWCILMVRSAFSTLTLQTITFLQPTLRRRAGTFVRLFVDWLTVG